MLRRRYEDDENKNKGSPAWMVTYGDMMTLLLCFFVLLYSFSSVDAEKFRAIISSFQGALGIMERGKTIIEDDMITAGQSMEQPGSTIMDEQELEALLQEFREFITDEGLEGHVEIIQNERGLTISFSGQVLFDLGQAKLRPEAVQLLQRTSEFLKQTTNLVRVEGHTCDLPIDTDRFPTNWELSTTRATTVVRYLVEEMGLDPQRLSAAGYSEYRPVADNEAEELRAKNRRVDIVILRHQLGMSEPQGRKKDG